MSVVLVTFEVLIGLVRRILHRARFAKSNRTRALCQHAGQDIMHVERVAQ
jgi:hypothetical protein